MKKSELEAILSDVEVEIAELLKSESAELRKGVGDEQPEASSEPEPSPGALGSAPGAPGASPEAGGDEGGPASAESAPAEGDTSTAPEGAPEGQPGGEPAEGGATDPAALEAEYEKLPPEELKAHYLACKSAIFKLMGGAGGGGPESAGPDASAGGPPPGGPGAPPMGKSARPMSQPKGTAGGISVHANGENDKKFGKSEGGIQAQLDVLTKALTLMAEQPVRKAVTGMSYIAKSEVTESRPLSKSEITGKLTEQSSQASLSKSDRQLINDYYDGKVSVEKISHLLK